LKYGQSGNSPRPLFLVQHDNAKPPQATDFRASGSGPTSIGRCFVALFSRVLRISRIQEIVSNIHEMPGYSFNSDGFHG
jgi:hypothetical protein